MLAYHLTTILITLNDLLNMKGICFFSSRQDLLMQALLESKLSPDSLCQESRTFIMTTSYNLAIKPSTQVYEEYTFQEILLHFDACVLYLNHLRIEI